MDKYCSEEKAQKKTMGIFACDFCNGIVERDENMGMGVCRKCGRVKHYVFISYSTKNQDSADYIMRVFTQEGIPVWMAPYDIPVGEKYAGVITDAVSNCSGLVLLLTEDSQNSSYVTSEVDLAMTNHKPILPVQLDKLELNKTFQFYIRANHILKLSHIDSKDPLFVQLIMRVKALVGIDTHVPESEQESKAFCKSESFETSRRKISDGQTESLPKKIGNADVSRIFGKKNRSCETAATGNKIRLTVFISAILIVAIAFGVTLNVLFEEKIKWSLDSAGTLTISGSGEMKDYPFASKVPWYSERENIKKVIVLSGVTSIGDFAFYGFDVLTSITIPYSVTDIGNNAFGNCKNLESITIPNSVTSIGKYAFEGCDILTNVTLSESLTSIDVFMFAHCESLTDITIPDNVSSIGWCAFYDCANLTGITVPNSVTSIDGEAFSGCDSLTSIIFKGTKVKWNNIFTDKTGKGNFTVHCTDGDIT